MRRRTIEVGATNVAATVRPQGYWPGDPTTRWERRGFAKSVLTPAGSGTIELSWATPGSVDVEAWGPGSDWLLERSPLLVGVHDRLDGFDPASHPSVDRWWRAHGNFRMSSGGVIWQELALVVLGQRVTTEEAVRTWAALCRRAGGDAPGPQGLMLPPAAAAVAAMTYAELHELNVERRRAETLITAAKRANRLEEAASMPSDEAYARLTALPGLGPWTATSTMTVSHGDPDVVVLRDYGIPTMVNYAFTGDVGRLPPDDGDERMVELLAPWAGHRQRIVRLLFEAGVSAPRRAPKMRRSDIRRF